MPHSASLARRSSRYLLATFIVGCACLAAPLHARQDGKSASEQAAARQKLAEVRNKMAALARQQADTAARRDSVNAALARQATALAAAAQALHQTDLDLAAKQQQLDQLQQQRSSLKQNLDRQQAAIADLLRATYALGHGSDLRLLLGDEDVARIARALVYSKYFQQDRLRRVQLLMSDLARLQQLESSITAEQQALQATRVQREAQAHVLAQQRAAQQKLAAATDAQYQDQTQRLAALKRNAQSLNQLVDRLQQAIDRRLRQHRAAEVGMDHGAGEVDDRPQSRLKARLAFVFQQRIEFVRMQRLVSRCRSQRGAPEPGDESPRAFGDEAVASARDELLPHGREEQLVHRRKVPQVHCRQRFRPSRSRAITQRCTSLGPS